MTFGRTTIDGDYIRTGTVDAQHIKANAIEAQHLTTQTLITSQAQIGVGSIADFHFGTGTIDGARINDLDVNRLKSGSLGAKRIQVGGTYGIDRSTIVIEGNGGYHTIRYHDSNAITRVEIGQNAAVPDPNRDGLIVRDLNGKVILHANGFGVQVMGTSGIQDNAISAMRFENTHTMGWSSIAGGNIHVVTFLTVALGGYQPGTSTPVDGGITVRFIFNGNVLFEQTMIGMGGGLTCFPYSQIIQVGAGTGLTWKVQMRAAQSVDWVDYGTTTAPNASNFRCQIVAVEYKK